MSEDKKINIESTVKVLEKLDGTSLALIDSGARMLLARQGMDKVEEGSRAS